MSDARSETCLWYPRMSVFCGLLRIIYYPRVTYQYSRGSFLTPITSFRPNPATIQHLELGQGTLGNSNLF